MACTTMAEPGSRGGRLPQMFIPEVELISPGALVLLGVFRCGTAKVEGVIPGNRGGSDGCTKHMSTVVGSELIGGSSAASFLQDVSHGFRWPELIVASAAHKKWTIDAFDGDNFGGVGGEMPSTCFVNLAHVQGFGVAVPRYPVKDFVLEYFGDQLLSVHS